MQIRQNVLKPTSNFVQVVSGPIRSRGFQLALIMHNNLSLHIKYIKMKFKLKIKILLELQEHEGTRIHVQAGCRISVFYAISFPSLKFHMRHIHDPTYSIDYELKSTSTYTEVNT